MAAFATPFNVVYHVAAIHHWQQVVREQLSVLARNRNIGVTWITLASLLPEQDAEAARLLFQIIREVTPSLACQIYSSRLQHFEHPAMILLDDLVRQSDHPVLYFHAKAVSYAPPQEPMERWRRHLNEFVAEADQWADFLARTDYDACGRLKLFDVQHGFTYFAGNFWMARAAHMRRLPLYADFVKNPPSSYFRPLDRYLAEVSVNRDKQMKGYATDGTDLTMATIGPHLHRVLR